MARSNMIFHLAYGINGLVTIDTFDITNPRIVRRTETVVADDAVACGGLLYVLTYLSSPTPSKVSIFDIASDPQVPQRLGETTLILAPGARIGCRGSQAYIGGGDNGLFVINAANPRVPTVVQPDNGTPGSAIGFYDMVIDGAEVRLITDMGGLPSRTEVLFTGDGMTTDFPAMGQTFVSFPPVVEGSISVTDGVEMFMDMAGSGTLVGDMGGSGSVDYMTGEVSVSFAAAPAAGTDIVASYNPPTPVCLNGAALPANCATSGQINCFGKFGVRSLRFQFDLKRPVCSGNWTDFRIPESADLEFPPSSGENTSPVSHPMAITEDDGLLYIASSNGRRLTVADNSGNVLFSDDIPGLPGGRISGLAASNGLLVLVDGNVRILDVTDPQNPFLSSTVVTPGTAFQVFIQRINRDRALAYIVDGNNGFSIIEITRTFFTPVPATVVARELSGAGAISVVPRFEAVSPLSDSPATAVSNFDEGVLAPGRLLVGSNRNLADAPGTPGNPSIDAPLAEGIVGGSLLSISSSAINWPVEPEISRQSLLGPYGLDRALARVYSQNSVCAFGDAGAGVFPNDSACELSTTAGGQLDGRYFAFAGSDPMNLPAMSFSMTEALSDTALAMHPSAPMTPVDRGAPYTGGLPTVQLVPTGSAVTAPDEQTGGYLLGGAPRGLTPMANPSALAITRDGFVFAASSGVRAAENAMGASTPYSLTLRPGRASLLDEYGAPFVYRRQGANEPFDLIEFNNAVASGSLAATLAASPFPVIPPYQLRDESGGLVDIPGCASPPCPQTPDRPPTGVIYADEQVRSEYLLPDASLPVALARTSNRPIDSTTMMPFGIPCETVDSNPFIINPSLQPHQDERTSLGLCHGIFGLAYAGSGADESQDDSPVTPEFDYFTRNPTYFATTGDGGVILIDLDSGISQVSPPGSLAPIAGGPDVQCDDFLSDVEDRDEIFAGTMGIPLECDAHLRMGLVYIPQKETLFVANPAGGTVTTISLATAGAGTPRGVKYQEGSLDFRLGGLLSEPVDIVPSQPLLTTTSQGTTSSDLFILDRGNGAIIRMTQSGDFIAIAEPRIAGRPIGRGRFAGMAINPEADTLYITLSEDCDTFIGGNPGLSNGCVIRVPVFGEE